ncbi:MAG: twin-arginine translocation signal domain-containing protein [Thermoguttaceae bacterium]|jgi:hypothetical protein|nr:twin-arginine translocation signal domain-containing protein [Thermoguttaceae bacterium]
MLWTRRGFLKASAAVAVGLGSQRGIHAGESLPPVRAITGGPKFHWFAYYDKLQFDATGRYALGMEVEFERRSPDPSDTIKIGMIDLADGDRWIELGRSRAWCWQQGCMLQWRPGSADEVLFNDREGDRFVCRILNVKTRKLRTLPHPIYAVSPDGRWAVATDFRRLADTRPGYGYKGIADPNRDVLAPRDSGIWRVDLESGRQDLLISLAEVAKIPFPGRDISRAKHWFNHLLVNPDGTRFEFLHRFKDPGATSHVTRMFTAAPDGSDLRIIDTNGLTSHFIWRDPHHILAWSKQAKPGFYVFEDKQGGKVELVGPAMPTGDGHCSYLPGNQWVLCDSYPDRNRNQHLYLYHIPTDRVVSLGHFQSPREYTGEWRCDLHPRLSRDGRFVTIDSPHWGGRQIYLVDLHAIIQG